MHVDNKQQVIYTIFMHSLLMTHLFFFSFFFIDKNFDRNRFTFFLSLDKCYVLSFCIPGITFILFIMINDNDY